MCQSLQELYSRFINKNRGDSTHNQRIENSNSQLSEWFKILSNSSPSSSPHKKRPDMDNRRPSDEENLCPPEHLHPPTQKKHAKLKYANSAEWEPNKRAKLSEESSSPKETRKKRDKGMNGDKHLTEARRRVSPSTRHRRTGSFDANCLKNSGNNRPHLNGEVSRTHSHSINSSQNTHVTHTEMRFHNGSCPSLHSTPSPSPDLPPKHPSHLLKLHPEHRLRHNGLIPIRGPSPLLNGSTTSEDSNIQSPGDVTVVKTEGESSNLKVTETIRPLDIRRAILSVKNRSVPTRPLIERIYSENRKRVNSSPNASTDSFQTSTNEVLYRQPSESPKYYHDIFSCKQKRPQLLKLIQTRLLLQHKKEHLLCVEQDRLQEKWENAVKERSESEAKKASQAKMKEQYERFYPELKRQREQERVARTTGCETELYEDNSVERHESVAAVIPAMIIDSRERETRFLSKNGYIPDLSKFTEQIKSTNIWTEQEKAIFKEQFHQYPKNFEQISSSLKNKSVPDCIQYYYLNKRQTNFKQSLKGSNGKRRKNKLQTKDSMYLYVKPRGTSLTSPDAQLTPRQRRTPDPDWNPNEVENLRKALVMYGKCWNKVAQVVGRSHLQCKAFFNDFSSIEEYRLRQAIDERNRLKAKERQERLANDSEEPLPPRNFSDELSDPDSPPRHLLNSPLHPSPPADTPPIPSHLLDHSYISLSSPLTGSPPTPRTLHANSCHALTRISPAMHSRLLKSLRESCLGKLSRSKKTRRNSASALLQPSNHRKLSSDSGLERRTPQLRPAAVDTERGRAAQERSASDTSMDQQALARTSNFSPLCTPTEIKTPVSVCAEVVTETDAPVPDPSDKPDTQEFSDYDSDQEGGRLVIDVDADDVIEEAPPTAHGDNFSSLPDLNERADEPEVFQSEDPSPSELSPDLTDLSPTPPTRFQDAWVYRERRADRFSPEVEQASAQFESYNELEPRRVDAKEDALSEIISKLELPLSDRPPKKKWNHLTLPPPRKPDPIRPIPTRYQPPLLPKAIHQTLNSLKSQESDHKRNVQSPPKETQKRFKPDTSQLLNGAAIGPPGKGEISEESKAEALRLFAQYQSELVQQPRMISYPLYHPMGQFLLQSQYLTPPQGIPPPRKFLYPPGVPLTLTKQQEQSLLVRNPLQNPLSSLQHPYSPSLLLPGPGLYPLPYPPAISQEGAMVKLESTRGPTNKHLERP